MEYRGVDFTVAEDDRGWQWTVFLGNPETVKTGHAMSKGTAILGVWAAIDRTLGSNKFPLVPSERSKT
jgi:hypothetical protein